jgi:hypothetical protein
VAWASVAGPRESWLRAVISFFLLILEFVHTGVFSALAKVIHGRDSKERCTQLGKVASNDCLEDAASACPTVIALH